MEPGFMASRILRDCTTVEATSSFLASLKGNIDLGLICSVGYHTEPKPNNMGPKNKRRVKKLYVLKILILFLS
jgi:hypothetical protein